MNRQLLKNQIISFTGDKMSDLQKKLKEMIKDNPYDKFFSWREEKLEDLGLKNIFNSFWHWVLGWSSFRTSFKVLWDYEVVGRKNFPEYGPAICISNHQSELDPFLVGSSIQRWIRWVSKKENFNIPIFKSVIKPFETIALARGESDDSAFRRIKAVLESGNLVGIFPEGTRSPDGVLQKFHKGAAKFCIECQTPYVPFYIDGSHKILPKNKVWYKMSFDHRVQVRVGKPVFIDPDIGVNLESLKYIRDEMKKDILLLQEGKFNEARTIKLSDINSGEMMKQEAEPIKEVEFERIEKERQKIPSFDPAMDFSIS